MENLASCYKLMLNYETEKTLMNYVKKSALPNDRIKFDDSKTQKDKKENNRVEKIKIIRKICDNIGISFSEVDLDKVTKQGDIYMLTVDDELSRIYYNLIKQIGQKRSNIYWSKKNAQSKK